MKKTKMIGAVSAAALAIGMMGVAVVPAASASGPETSYLVLAPQGKSTAKAAARVAAAGGTVVAAYDQIGVLVARSTNTAFASAVAGSGVESVASTEGLGTTLIDDEIVEAVDSAAVEATGDPTAEPLWSRQWDMAQIDVPAAHAVTTGDPSIVVGVLDSGIDATHPDLATQVAKDQSASCIGGVVDTNRGGVEPDDLDARHARGRHDRRSHQRRRHRGRGTGREGRLGEGRQRRRLHLPRGRDLRLPLGSRPRHADHEQQLLHRPVGVQLPQRRAPAPGLAGRAARAPLLRGAGHPHDRLGRKQQRRPAAQVHRRRQPERRQRAGRGARRSTTRASTSRPKRPVS